MTDDYTTWGMCRGHLVSKGELSEDATQDDAERWCMDNLDYDGCENCPHASDCPLNPWVEA